jgi:hypothetical protein
MSSMAGRISMGARREVVSAVTERYRSAKRAEKGRILDALCATTGWHRKHAVRALRRRGTVGPGEVEAPQERKRRYGATIKDAMTALWEASDRVCGKRLKVMIPILLPHTDARKRDRAAMLHPNASLKRQIPLAPRAPSIHGTFETCRRTLRMSAYRRGPADSLALKCKPRA